MAVREGKWKCRHCGGVSRGSQLHCASCGVKRGEDVRFFLEDDAPVVTEAALLAKARGGAEWLCEYCGRSNPPDTPRCSQCGADSGDARSREVREIRAGAEAPQPALSRPLARSGGRGRVILASLLLLVLGFCGYFGYVATRKTEETVRVAGFHWERRVAIEALRTLREEAWQDSVPSGARVVSTKRDVRETEREQVGTERVKVGTRDLGNGFFEDVYEDQPVYKERPIYDQKVSYDIERWVKDREARSAGEDASPRWPELALRPGEREGSRSESCVVLLQGQKTYRMKQPCDGLARFEVGARRHAVIRGGVSVVELKEHNAEPR